MTANEYQNIVMSMRNCKLSEKDLLLSGVMGLCGEAGEVIELVKKWFAQGHSLDRDRLISELGDVAWYLAATAYALQIPLDDVLTNNIEKLKARYPQGFCTENSVHRK